MHMRNRTAALLLATLAACTVALGAPAGSQSPQAIDARVKAFLDETKVVAPAMTSCLTVV